MSKEKQPWTVTAKSYQIADTGDYDGHYEISNGDITLYTKDEDEGDQSEDQGFEELVAALNKTRATFWTNGDDEAYGNQMEAEHFKRECHAMTTALAAKDAEIQRLKGFIRLAHDTGYVSGNLTNNPRVEKAWQEFKTANNL